MLIFNINEIKSICKQMKLYDIIKQLKLDKLDDVLNEIKKYC